MKVKINLNQVDDQTMEVPFDAEAGNVLIHVSNPEEGHVVIDVSAWDDAETVAEFLEFVANALRENFYE